MPRDKNKGLHGNCLIGPQLGHAEPIEGIYMYIKQRSFVLIIKYEPFPRAILISLALRRGIPHMLASGLIWNSFTLRPAAGQCRTLPKHRGF
jgi:hypothetical protein